jgi:hypothetical protein
VPPRRAGARLPTRRAAGRPRCSAAAVVAERTGAAASSP